MGLGRLQAAAGSALAGRARQLPPTRRLRYRMTRATLDRLGEGRLRVLDAGCGDGLLAASIARQHPAWTVVGIDADEAMIARARALAAASRLPNVEYRVGDLTGSLGELSYDVVIALECLTEIEDDSAALDSLCGAVRPDGLLVLQVAERDWRPVMPGSERTWRHEVRHGYGQDQLRQELERRGLETRRLEATTRSAVRLAQEIRDRTKERRPAVQALLLPALALGVWLEAHGLTWGPPTALYAEAVRGHA